MPTHSASHRLRAGRRTEVPTVWTERIIRFQFRRTGLNHRAIVKDNNPRPGESLHVTMPYITLCGMHIPGGHGGWGHGPKDCQECVNRMRVLRAGGMHVNPREVD